MDSVITIDVEGTSSSSHQPQNKYDSIRVVERFIAMVEVPVTMFITPDVVEQCTGTVRKWLDMDTTVGLHIHPSRFDGGASDRLTEYGRDAIEEFLIQGSEVFQTLLDTKPTCFRAGRWEYSEELLEALHAQGFEIDASLKPETAAEPYSLAGITELPLTVYSNAAIRMISKTVNFSGIPMHADAFLKNFFLTCGFFGVTWRLVRSDRSYIMVSFHDYDLLNGLIRKRLPWYLWYLVRETQPRTIDEIGQ